MLTPVSEALNLLDVAYVNNDGQNSPATVRRVVQILVDHISMQNAQLGRVEEILAAYGTPSQQGGTVWTKLAAKADLSRLEKLETQCDAALADGTAMKVSQHETDLRCDNLHSRLEELREQLGSLEQRVGFAAGGQARLCSAGSGPTSPSRSTAAGVVNTAVAVSGSLLDRLQRAERKLENAGAAVSKHEGDVSGLASSVQELHGRLEAQLSHLRTDIKQALALAAASSKAEAESEASGRTREAERRLLARMHSLEEGVEARVAGVSAKVAGQLGMDLDKRFQSLYEQLDNQVGAVRGDLDRLARDKVDASALEAYTTRVSGLFEQVAASLGDDVRDVSNSSQAAVQGVRRDVAALAADKADRALEGSVALLDDKVRALGGQLGALATAVSEQAAAQPAALEEVRAGVRGVSGELEVANRAISGLNSALSSSSTALELQAHKLLQLGHRLQSCLSDVSALKEALYGSPAAGAAQGTVGLPEAASSANPGALAGPNVLTRLSGLERQLSDVAVSLGGKADDSTLRDTERRITALQRQADQASEGVRSLSSSTYKRVDEHASAIQRLTLAISSHMEERPTQSTVQNMIEASHLEAGEKLASGLLPVWDALKSLQHGLREAGSAAQAAQTQVAGLQQQQAELRSKSAAERSALVTLVMQRVEEEVVGAPGSGLKARLSALDLAVRELQLHLDAAAGARDKQAALTGALEEQVTKQVSALRSSFSTLHSELAAKLDACEAGLEAVGISTRQCTNDLQAVRDQVASRPTVEEVKQLAQRTTQNCVVEQAAHNEQEQQALRSHLQSQLERYPTRSEVETGLAAVASAARQAVRDAEAASEARTGQAEERATSAARLQADSRVRGAESRLTTLAGRLEAVEHTMASSQELQTMMRVLEGKVERHELESRVRHAEEVAERGLAGLEASVTAQLAKKLDMRTYLASSSASAAAAAAAAGAVPRAVSPAHLRLAPSAPQQQQPLDFSRDSRSSPAPSALPRPAPATASALPSAASLQAWNARMATQASALLQRGQALGLEQDYGQQPRAGGYSESAGVGTLAATAAIARLGEKLRQATLAGQRGDSSAP